MTKKENSGSKWSTIGALSVAAFVATVACGDEVVTTVLTEDGQGGQGNVGELFRPIDENGDPATFVLSAASALDRSEPFNPDAAGLVGTVHIDEEGGGVQGPNGEGSAEISGDDDGSWSNEELIFTFDEAVLATELLLGLGDVEFDDDDRGGDDDRPVIWLSVADSGEWGVFIDTDELQDAFIEDDDDTGTIDFSRLANLDPDLRIDAFKIRETGDDIFVTHLTTAAVVPPPPPPPPGPRKVVEGQIVRVRKFAVYVQEADGTIIAIHVHPLTPIRRNGAKVELRKLRIGDSTRIRVTKDKDHLRLRFQAQRIRATGRGR